MDHQNAMDFSSWDNVELKDGLTIQDIVNILENDEDGEEDYDIMGADIFITPPEPSALTDEDSADEDVGGIVDNLSGRQLLVEAGVRLYRRENASAPKHTHKQNKSNKSQPQERNWVDGDLQHIRHCLFDKYLKDGYNRYAGMNAVQLFELFIDNQIIIHIHTEIRKYAGFLNKADPCISISEIKAFIGILILSGYNNLPGKKYYWDTQSDMKNTLVSEAMRRDRFILIMKFMHLADNTQIDKADKFYQIRPLTKHMQAKCLEHFVPHEYLSYDESMIKYFGKHSCKQFIRGKPIRFGYKAWCLNTDFGYMVNFDFYQGKNPEAITEYEGLVGNAASPLLAMLDQIPVHKQNLPYHIFFDNFFTGFNLLDTLRSRGYFGTGTIRENRIPKDCPLPSNNSLKKSQRGSSKSSLETKSGIFLVKWKDNAVVSAASAAFGNEPIHKVKRYSQKEKKVISVSQPRIIGEYNKHMGGTDRMDQDINAYRIGIRGKKFWWCLFTWHFDVALQNAWVLYKKANGPISNLQFKREIVQTYLKTYKTAIKSPGGAKSKPAEFYQRGSEVCLRYDNVGHFVAKTENNKRRKCALRLCSSQTRTQCIKCDAGLCIECFIIYHTK